MNFNLKKFGVTCWNTVKKYSPQILTVGGIGLIIYGTVKATQVTPAAKETIAEFKTCREACDNPELAPETAESMKKEAYKSVAKNLVSCYALPAACIVGGSAMIFGAHNIMDKRLATVTAGLTSLERMYNNYRGNVIEKYGEEEDFRLRTGIKTEEVETVEHSTNGRTRKVKKDIEYVDPSIAASPFVRFFDESNPNFSKVPSNNAFFLDKIQTILNNQLQAQGYVFLNDVLYALGYDRCSEGQIWGWIYDPDNPACHNFIDLGIKDTRRKTVQNFVNGYEPVVMLNFNVDGIIYDKLPKFA